MRPLTILSLCSMALWPLAAAAQQGPAQMPARPLANAPLLYVRFAQPAGMSVTFYQGRMKPRKLMAPVTVGVRPGYVYRVKLSEFADYPGLNLYPTLDVRGSLSLPPQSSAAKHPAPFVLSNEDIDKVLGNTVLTKVVYLEDPETAEPVRGQPGEMLAENNVPSSRDLLMESRQYGRPLFGWRLGELPVEEADLMAQSIQGTILFPGDTFLPQAARPPYVPFACVPYFDPLLGPAPAREECLHDGGDIGRRAGIGPDGRLAGLDPSDTVAEYSDAQGRKQVAVSNRVSICAPRFAALRNELSLGGTESSFVVDRLHHVASGASLQAKVPSATTRQSDGLGAVQGRERPSAALNQEGLANVQNQTILHGIDMEEGPFALLTSSQLRQLTNEQRSLIVRQMELAQVLSGRNRLNQISGSEATYAVGQVVGTAGTSEAVMTRDLTMTIEDMVPVLPDRPLLLRKWVKEHDARVGDVVTFMLRYSNSGGQPISAIAVSDSLTGRLEFVNGSAKSDRPAVFTTQQNEAGSVILRWEIQGQLPAGENGVVSFQARIR